MENEGVVERYPTEIYVPKPTPDVIEEISLVLKANGEITTGVHERGESKYLLLLNYLSEKEAKKLRQAFHDSPLLNPQVMVMRFIPPAPSLVGKEEVGMKERDGVTLTKPTDIIALDAIIAGCVLGLIIWVFHSHLWHGIIWLYQWLNQNNAWPSG